MSQLITKNNESAAIERVSEVKVIELFLIKSVTESIHRNEEKRVEFNSYKDLF
jgi:hypothetical protein